MRRTMTLSRGHQGLGRFAARRSFKGLGDAGDDDSSDDDNSGGYGNGDLPFAPVVLQSPSAPSAQSLIPNIQIAGDTNSGSSSSGSGGGGGGGGTSSPGLFSSIANLVTAGTQAYTAAELTSVNAARAKAGLNPISLQTLNGGGGLNLGGVSPVILIGGVLLLLVMAGGK